MPCERVKIGDTVGIACTGRARRKKCAFCGAPAGRLCDLILEVDLMAAEKRTCDKPLCTRCSMREGETDYCPDHGVVPRRGQLELVL